MNAIIKQLYSWATRSPSIVAISDGHRSLTWSELLKEVEAVSNKLKEIDSNSVGIHMDNSIAWIICDLAAMNIGIRIIPIPVFFSRRQISHSAKNGNVDTIITTFANHLAYTAQVYKQPSTLTVSGEALSIIRRKSSDHIKTASEKVTYTSGTTGKPKGVILSTEHIVTVAQSVYMNVKADNTDRALAIMPLSVLLENIVSVYVPILAGAQILVPSPQDSGLTGSSDINILKFSSILNTLQPTTIVIPPQLLKVLIHLSEHEKLSHSFRYIAVGSAPVGQSLLYYAHTLGLPVYQGYGLSEACSVISVNTPDHNRLGSVGKPLPHCRVRITESGEIIVKGTTLSGYINQPYDIQSEFCTGDSGYIDDDGFLYITGRIKNNFINSYGRNISPEWIESELTAYPLIDQAIVVGEGRPCNTAIITTHTTVDSILGILNDVNERLPDYARIKHTILTEKPFTIRNGQLSSRGLLRRDVIEAFYQNDIDTIYGEEYACVL